MVAEGVVDLLEAVEVHEHDGGQVLVAPGPGRPHLSDPLEEERAIGQAGE